MTNLISDAFGIKEIFYSVFNDNRSLVPNYRITSKQSFQNCERFFEVPWENFESLIQNHIPRSIFTSDLTSINNSIVNFYNSTCIRHTKLSQIISKYFPQPLAIGHKFLKSEFNELEQSVRDLALTPIWNQVKDSIDPSQCSSLPTPPSPSAEEIRKFLNDLNNVQALLSVKEINLSGLGLKKVPPELSRLQGLERLYLSENQIIKVPDFSYLPELTLLDLSNNQIANVPDFNALPKLTVLALSNNKIAEVPDFNHLLQLTELSLCNNQITEVRDFSHLPKLTVLALSKNKIAKVPDFNHLPQLTCLYFNNNQITEVPDFNHLPQLTTLGLSHNKITTVPDFNHLPQLTYLFLYNSQIAEVPDFNHLLKLITIDLDESIFIPDALLLRFPELISKLTDRLDYKCESSLALLWQLILRNNSVEVLTRILSSLTIADQNLIFQMVWEKAGKPMNGDLQWGEHHAFDNPILFALAVREAIFTKLAHLSQDEKNKVYGHVYELAGSPQTPDLQWGENHAKTHLCCLADAISRVLKP